MSADPVSPVPVIQPVAPPAAPVPAVAASPWYRRFLSWFEKAATTLFRIVLPGVEAGIAGFLNDPQNQAVALAAVKAAIDRGFRGQDAWTAARAALEARLTASGRQVAGTVMDTILQNAYCAVKYAVANHPEVDVPSAPSVQ